MARSCLSRPPPAFKSVNTYQRTKNPASIRYQFTKPAPSPITKTTITMVLSLLVVGLPALSGQIIRNSPPTPHSGANAASFMEYLCACNKSCQLTYISPIEMMIKPSDSSRGLTVFMLLLLQVERIEIVAALRSRYGTVTRLSISYR